VHYLFFLLASNVTMLFASVEAVASDSVMAAQGQSSLDKAVGDCLLTPSVNHGDSHAVSEQSTVLSTKGCDTLTADMMSKGQDCLEPSGLPETSSSTVVKCGASINVELKLEILLYSL
jgi:hypothetical protein